MSEAIVSALIAGAVTLAVCLINNLFQQRRLAETMAQQQRQTASLLEYKLDALTEKVEQHNRLVERTYHLEEQSTLHEERLKVANHRIEDLERSCNPLS